MCSEHQFFTQAQYIKQHLEIRYITKACKFGKFLEIALQSSMAIASTALGRFHKTKQIKHTKKQTKRKSYDSNSGILIKGTGSALLTIHRVIQSECEQGQCEATQFT